MLRPVFLYFDPAGLLSANGRRPRSTIVSRRCLPLCCHPVTFTLARRPTLQMYGRAAYLDRPGGYSCGSCHGLGPPQGWAW